MSLLALPLNKPINLEAILDQVEKQHPRFWERHVTEDHMRSMEFGLYDTLENIYPFIDLQDAVSFAFDHAPYGTLHLVVNGDTRQQFYVFHGLTDMEKKMLISVMHIQSWII